jgi:hypothetical protein
VSFTATPTNGGTAPIYQWKLNNVNVGGNSATYTNSSFVNGDVVQCVMTSNAACVVGNPAVSNSVTMGVNPLPVADAGDDQVIFSGQICTLSAGAINGSPPYSFFWSNGVNSVLNPVSPMQTTLYILTITDNAGCSDTDSAEVVVLSLQSSLSGYVTYDNVAHTPMTNTTVYLKQGSTIVSQTTTDQTGYFMFANPPAGTFVLSGSTSKPWGGINSTDALLITRHFAGMLTLAGLKLTAGDVNGNIALNSLDALLVARRFAGIINTFNVGDWVFSKETIVISGTTAIVQNLKALCTGDVNGSYTPLP